MATFVYPTRKRPVLHSKPMQLDILTGDCNQTQSTQGAGIHLTQFAAKSGQDIEAMPTRSSLVDDNLPIYFLSKKARHDYIRIPLNHPSLNLPVTSSIDHKPGG